MPSEAVSVLRVIAIEDDPAMLAEYALRLRTPLAAGDGAAQWPIEWCGGAASGKEGLALLDTANPHVVLVDLGLPDMNGFELIREIRQQNRHIDVLVVSVFGSEFHLLHAIEAGATGYLLKDAKDVEFVSAIRSVHAGESPISPSLARHLLRRCIGQAPLTAEPAGESPDKAVLSPREVQVLELVAKGQSVNEIANALFISAHTVKSHVKNVYAKLETHSKQEAVFRAKVRGYIRP